jgi:hypothetical protein
MYYAQIQESGGHKTRPLLNLPKKYFFIREKKNYSIIFYLTFKKLFVYQ